MGQRERDVSSGLSAEGEIPAFTLHEGLGSSPAPPHANPLPTPSLPTEQTFLLVCALDVNVLVFSLWFTCLQGGGLDVWTGVKRAA